VNYSATPIHPDLLASSEVVEIRRGSGCVAAV
jgi:hypothetical protein